MQNCKWSYDLNLPIESKLSCGILASIGGSKSCDLLQFFILILARASNLKNTVYRMSCCKSLPVLILHILALIQKTISHYYSARRHEPSTSSIATARTETTREPTYSMVRVIGATAWQKCFICQCHYLHCHSQCKSLVTWIDLSNGHIDEGYRMS